MKQKISILTAISVLVLAVSSCTVKEKTLPASDDLDLALEEVFVEDLMEDILVEAYDEIFDAAEYGILKSDSSEREDCRIRTVERPEGEKWPKVVTIDFGEGCEDRKGNVRAGKIIISVSGRYKEEGSIRVITFEDYYVNGNRIEGTQTITNQGREDGFLVFGVVLENGKIITPDSLVIERSASKTRVWIEGEETPGGWDDVFLVNGIVNKVNRNGIQITKSITDLVRARSCRFPLSGIVEITADDDRPIAVIDYGEGECDRFAIVTVGEGEDAETWIFDLKEHRRWRQGDKGEV